MEDSRVWKVGNWPNLVTFRSNFDVPSINFSQIKWPHKRLWYIRVPLKVKVFLWLARHNNILTKDNLLHRGWKGKEEQFMSCDMAESVNHFFFGCALAKFLWSLIKCSFCLRNSPNKFVEIHEWAWSFSSRARSILRQVLPRLFGEYGSRKCCCV